MSLETFVPEPVVVEIAGETLAITPLKVGELPTFIQWDGLLPSTPASTCQTGEVTPSQQGRSPK